MYKILFLLTFLLPINAVAFDPCAEHEYVPIAERYERGMFFEISKCGVEDSHILGTMHSDIPQVYASLPPSVSSVLSQASSANFELKKDGAMQQALFTAMFYPLNLPQNLRSTIGDDRYAQLQQVLRKNRKDLSENTYAKMRPWAVAILMQVPADSNSGVHLDAKLEAMAEEKSVPVYGLETVQEQLSIFTDLPEAEQIEFLQEAIDNLEIIELMNDKLLSRYLQADLKGLQSLAAESFGMMKNADLKKRLESKLIQQRNLVMLERMQPRLAEGNAFIAVGALHLPTDLGLLKLLEEQGYYIHVVND